MAFRFNFCSKGTSVDEDSEPIVKKRKEVVAQFKEITVEDCKTVYPCDLEVKSYDLSDHIKVCCYDAAAVEEILKKDKDKSSTVVKATSKHSDLVPNVYEGGLTVWECGIDLATYLAHNEDFSDKTVLELGCGAGIPGICSIYLGASQVHFQDYNAEVIEEYTIPNVVQLNIEDDVKCKYRFFSGDWRKFNENLEKEQKYDVIMTAETIYNPNNYQKLHDVFSSRLKKDGVIYLAAKSNYFGVGGGTAIFEDYVNKMDTFSCNICKTIEAGVPREILKLKWKENKSKDKEEP